MNEKIKSFSITEDENGNVKFTENVSDTVLEKSTYLVEKYGELAKDVAIDILDSFKHEDNRMYYEITFWEKVISNFND